MEQIIDRAFAHMLSKYGIHRVLGLTPQHIRVLRYQVKRGIYISLDKKHRLLKKSGWSPDQHRWTDADVLEAIKMTIGSGGMAKQFGAGYILDKWKMKNGY